MAPTRPRLTPAIADVRRAVRESLADLPGLEELKGAGLLSSRLPPNMQIPLPFDGPLREDEDPLDPDDIEGQDEEQ